MTLGLYIGLSLISIGVLALCALAIDVVWKVCRKLDIMKEKTREVNVA